MERSENYQADKKFYYCKYEVQCPEGRMYIKVDFKSIPNYNKKIVYLENFHASAFRSYGAANTDGSRLPPIRWTVFTQFDKKNFSNNVRQPIFTLDTDNLNVKATCGAETMDFYPLQCVQLSDVKCFQPSSSNYSFNVGFYEPIIDDDSQADIPLILNEQGTYEFYFVPDISNLTTLLANRIKTSEQGTLDNIADPVFDHLKYNKVACLTSLNTTSGGYTKPSALFDNVFRGTTVDAARNLTYNILTLIFRVEDI